MGYNYSISYPDKEKTEYFKDEVNASHIMQLFNSFNWAQELQKPVEYYSPSIEINRLSDKVKLILTGVGNEKLDDFMVSLLIPKPDTIANEFDRKDYKKSKHQEERLSIAKSQMILNIFLSNESPEQLSELFSSVNEKFAIQFSLGPLQILAARIGGILLVIMLSFVLLMMVRDEFGFWPIAIISSLVILFLIASIKV